MGTWQDPGQNSFDLRMLNLGAGGIGNTLRWQFPGSSQQAGYGGGQSYNFPNVVSQGSSAVAASAPKQGWSKENPYADLGQLRRYLENVSKRVLYDKNPEGETNPYFSMSPMGLSSMMKELKLREQKALASQSSANAEYTGSGNIDIWGGQQMSNPGYDQQGYPMWWFE